MTSKKAIKQMMAVGIRRERGTADSWELVRV